MVFTLVMWRVCCVIYLALKDERRQVRRVINRTEQNVYCRFDHSNTHALSFTRPTYVGLSESFPSLYTACTHSKGSGEIAHLHRLTRVRLLICTGSLW